jgi:hypothetical protein
MANAERLLDLDRQAGEQVPERVLQREANHHCAHARRREQLLAQQQRANHGEDRDHAEVLDDGGELVGGAILAPGIDEQRDRGVDDRQNQREAGDRRQQRGIAETLADRQLQDCEAGDQPERE